MLFKAHLHWQKSAKSHCHDTQHIDTQHNDAQHNGNQHDGRALL